MMKQLLPFPELPRPLYIGHRGYSSLAPENTMEAFDLCLSRGIPVIELDIHICGTGELAVIHDSSTLRTTGTELIVEESSWEQISRLDAGSWKGESFIGSRVPRLEDLFTAFGSSLHYDIELKQGTIEDTGLAAAVWKVISDYRLQNRCMVSSFNPFVLRRFVRASRREVPTAVIYAKSIELPRVLRKGFGRSIAGCEVLKPMHDLITGTDRRQSRYPMIAWTVDSPQEARRVLTLGAEGIITNDPGRIREATAAFRQ